MTEPEFDEFFVILRKPKVRVSVKIICHYCGADNEFINIMKFSIFSSLIRSTKSLAKSLATVRLKGF